MRLQHDQKNLDNPHKDFVVHVLVHNRLFLLQQVRRKRLHLFFLNLEGKIHGMALRVPTPNVSLVDLSC